MIDYENEDLGKFPRSMVVNYLRNVTMFSGERSKQKFVNWCLCVGLYELLAKIAMVDYKHI